ncbi:MAG: methylenetetrahydrofolate--tRNA-(uracil(54)-C(5))-methyltransferase (FADH(2)-oxidizing) TrmFO [Erysipelotrichaceae bacterium]|uniref:Methylenetetrahydrofolate--tRNA-(uracil-5-)-methyltransferase TrmFO n=1 Tax=Copranaerobaculum intestinale TaxID=2692629 RepID=A0A6N8U5W0_9FIRM|nr:methylenetetrahydrofolate--tRNA-(uracil(54)-C(5))-methyltransferase (FADH(2)-oxidizing) TrmFO [Copranaerobaculum intestinale]MBS6373313.1 methylenetetrahydrofolate--tRNA-(uracil(54)-C(5))-methyltransferase (FADH(2)-oxidizing) TrmFO [Erysipelotrichaceae bacterium]MXQ73588.1 methylenetetrahydrofolate--tRNA-(uracil(54)-C(5))-methyltransferase (FADH(2)-oxidizing) TrmFO [Copranaerobaculum intestinale]
MKQVTVVGAGLAGCEAAWQLANRGISVTLIEMRPVKMTPAHKTADFAELVCSNSLRSDALTNAVGVLKQEMRMLNSVIMEAADAHRVPAGSALAVDREAFAKTVTEKISSHPNITIEHREVCELPSGPVILATGPLTSDALGKAVKALLHEDTFYFYDAAAPIVERDSIDFTKAYFKSRYDKGDADYINCPMNEEEFHRFYEELIHAKTADMHEFEDEKYFEGCMPFEEMARRGEKTLLFGPMKPVGLQRPDGTRPYAVVQLRQDNAAASLYNIVGFQTHLTWGEQKRILALVPGLENASIVRYGVMHRNTYICSPKVLKPTYQCTLRDDLYFAGQMCGVEGYVESAASGLLAGINMAKQLLNEAQIILPPTCVMGSMAHYITHTHPDYFQPMNANFGIMQLLVNVKKKDRKEAYGKQALEVMESWLPKLT